MLRLFIILSLSFCMFSCKPKVNEFEQAKTYTDNGQFKEALEILNQIIIHQPKFDSAYLERAYVFNMMGDYEKSLQDYNHAISNTELRLSVLEQRAWLNIDFGKHEQALKDLNHIILLDKNYYTAYTGRGYVKTLLKIYDKDPNNRKYNQENDEHGFYYFDLTGAINDFNHSLKINPQYIEAYIERGKVYKQMDSIILALNDFNKAIAIDSNNFDAVFNRGVLLMNDSHSEHYALVDLNKSIQINPNNALSYKYRADIYRRHQKKEKACADYQKMEELGFKMTTDEQTYCH